jgi:hypothetical protein
MNIGTMNPSELSTKTKHNKNETKKQSQYINSKNEKSYKTERERERKCVEK